MTWRIPRRAPRRCGVHAVVFLITVLLAGCGGTSAPAGGVQAETASTGSDTTGQAPAPTAAAIPSTVPTAGPTPLPTPPPELVSLGQTVQSGPVTLVVHGFQRVAWLDSIDPAAPAAERVVVDLSVRNELPQALTWSVGRGIRMAILGADGTPVNAEPDESLAGGIGLLTNQPTTECRTLAAVRSSLEYVRNADTLAPGAVLRQFVTFRATPGLEASGLQLEVIITGPTNALDVQAQAPSYRAMFQLDGTASAASLPWSGPNAQPTELATLNATSYSSARLGPVTAAKTFSGSDEPCVQARTLTVEVENTSAQSVSPLPSGGAVLVDADGRRYTQLLVPGVDPTPLGPRERRTLTLAFPAVLGVSERPLALLLTGEPSSAGTGVPESEWVLVRVDS